MNDKIEKKNQLKRIKKLPKSTWVNHRTHDPNHVIEKISYKIN
jgi:hypothetical protein